ncbi:hypothetical protein OIU80_16765 [Flavobacterium sp. LS1R47]|uniref:Lipocalin-like domain-containing protein n=1 Tax=Flavobacterium frigoritolerans TaxID=2987686 RepID=A0A9X3HM62_9FLAO|nr:hypothetical protein [Flavobacterium frigoritolerans]MCV9933937.1 hypothetical protein [Flavobacterium frigoritolerans]
MKNILNLAATLVVLLTIMSCEKKSVLEELNGSWELRHIEGIQVANVDPNFKPGNGNLLKFEGQKYERYYDGKKEESGTFTITPEDTTINNRKANYSITFNNNTEKTYLSLLNNKLILFNGVIAADGTESTYEKQ